MNSNNLEKIKYDELNKKAHIIDTIEGELNRIFLSNDPKEIDKMTLCLYANIADLRKSALKILYVAKRLKEIEEA